MDNFEGNYELQLTENNERVQPRMDASELKRRAILWEMMTSGDPELRAIKWRTVANLVISLADAAPLMAAKGALIGGVVGSAVPVAGTIIGSIGGAVSAVAAGEALSWMADALKSRKVRWLVNRTIGIDPDLTPDVSRNIAWGSEIAEIVAGVPTHLLETGMQFKADWKRTKKVLESRTSQDRAEISDASREFGVEVK